MINLKSLKINIASVIKELSSKNVIWSNQNANCPSGEFILLKISNFKTINSTDYESESYFSNNKYFTKSNGDREFILNIQCISENCVEILLDLLNKIKLNSNSNVLDEKKLVFVSQDTDIIDITTIINGAYESRASVDVVFRISKNYSSEDINETDIIEKIEIDAVLQDNAKQQPIEFDISVEQNNN